MKIQRITFAQNYNLINQNNKAEKKQNTDTAGSIGYASIPFYNDISFQARVDKSLVRFYEANKNRMPQTVKKFVEKLPDKNIMTPLQAQAEAFLALAGVTTIASIQANYPEEELFTTLEEPKKTKATRGILGVYRQDKDLLELENRDILASKENLTVWLVKKIFLEGKTIEEINQDFEKEADSEFLALYKAKEKDGLPIRPSTLKALGIQNPNSEYMQSLRFTREGYSDMIGERISQGLKDFMDSLSPEQRTERARGTVLRFIKHWESIPLDKKLDMLLEQDREVVLLEMYKNARAEKATKNENKANVDKKNEVVDITKNTPTTSSHNREKVETGITYDDELYSMWARNNFVIFELTLDDDAKKLLQIKREQKRAERWAAMTPEEQTEYISKMKTGAEPLRYALIDAWNNNPDILISLSKFLKKRNIERPDEFIFRSVEYNRYQSEIMTEFWATNPDYALRWGESIKESHYKVKASMNDNTYEDLKVSIMKAKAERGKAVKEKIETYAPVLPKEIYMQYPEYIRDFIDLYTEKNYSFVKYLPKEYLKDFFDVSANEISEATVHSWEKELRGEELTAEDLSNIETVKSADSKKVNQMNRALEVATADVLYKLTGEPLVYRTPAAECKMILSKLNEVEQRISYIEKDGTTRDVVIPKSEIDIKTLENLYRKYKTPVSKEYVDRVIKTFYLDFFANNSNQELLLEAYLEMKDYLSNYGRGLEILYNQPNTHIPEVREQYFMQLLSNSPAELKTIIKESMLRTKEEFITEDCVHKVVNAIKSKYYFIPENGYEGFRHAYSNVLRAGNAQVLQEIYDSVIKQHDYNNEYIMYPVIFKFSRKHVTTADCLSLLCAEQAMADVLYNATGEPKVYSMVFEELADAIERFAKIKKVNNQQQIVQARVLKTAFPITLKKKLNFYQMDKNIAEYKENVLDYMQSINPTKDIIDGKEILYSLNTDEEKSFLDEYVSKRIDFTLEN